VPPAAVKSVKDLIYWQYAKIVAESAGMGKKDYGFVLNKFKQLKQNQILWNGIKEYIKEKETMNKCVFCGESANLALDHLLPQKYNGPNVEKNLVWVCKNCGSKKGARRLYEYFALQTGVEAAKYDVPIIAEGKYLKFAYETLKENKLLETRAAHISDAVCPRCDMKSLCIRQDTEGELSPLCIDGMLTLCFREKR
jgi:Zn finger protein HypA/HybF involved in hydrogenase expression